jgi:predicted nucleotidyltransferase
MPTRSQRSVQSDQAFRDQLDAAINRLVADFKPIKILLFGSWLEGVARPESSIDLLIITHTESRFVDRIKQAIKSTEGLLPNVTPLVYTPEEVELLQKEGDGFIEDILEQGKVLYSR